MAQPEQLVVVASVQNRVEAALVEGVLKDVGIDCFISGDDADGWRPELTFTRGIRILCFERDEARARELLRELES